VTITLHPHAAISLAAFLCLTGAAVDAAAATTAALVPCRPGTAPVLVHGRGVTLAVSPCSGGVQSARLTDPQFQMRARPPVSQAPQWAQARWQAGPLDLVETWDAKWDPARDAIEWPDPGKSPDIEKLQATVSIPGSVSATVVDLAALAKRLEPWAVVAPVAAGAVTLVWPDPARVQSPVYLEKTVRPTPDGRQHAFAVEIALWNLGAAPVSLHLHHDLHTYQDPAREVSWIDSLSGAVEQKGAAFAIAGESVHHELPGLADADVADRARPGVPDWLGVGSRYFLLATAPVRGFPQGGEVRMEALANGVVRAQLKSGAIALQPGAGACVPAWWTKPGETRPVCGKDGGAHVQRLQYDLYAGPKSLELLEPFGHGLKGAIDLGWFTAIAMPMIAVLKWAHGWSGSWPLAIFALTLLVRVLLWPLTGKGLQSMRKMQTLKPELDKLRADFEAKQKKYGKDKVDPNELNRATFELYRKHGVNPFGGCLPLLLQMPVYIALYRTILSAVDLYNQPLFGWVTDLTQKDPYYVLPLLLGGVMFAQQKITPQAGGDPAQQKMLLYFMPALFTFMMLALPSGLTLYILVNTLLGILQTFLVNKAMPVPKPAT
jgi:YidC/Oxa1 family membrane protein insertase